MYHHILSLNSHPTHNYKILSYLIIHYLPIPKNAIDIF